MSQNMTYDTLKAMLLSYSTRRDQPFLDQVDNFFVLAENRVATDMKQQGFQSVVTGTLDAGQPSMAKPAFWRETIALYVIVAGERRPVHLRSYDYCRNYSPDATQDVPEFYADYNFSNFLLTPTPDAAYPFELSYYARLQPLTEAAQTNWLTLNMPQAIFGALMLEASIWVKNPQQEARWQAYYDNARGGAIQENQERLADRNLEITRG